MSRCSRRSPSGRLSSLASVSSLASSAAADNEWPVHLVDRGRRRRPDRVPPSTAASTASGSSSKPTARASRCSMPTTTAGSTRWCSAAPGCAMTDARRSTWPAGEAPTARLYRNRRDGTFEDVTRGSGLDRKVGWASGVCAGDYDNDGRLDLFVTYFGQNVLYRNLGGGRFEDQTDARGLGGRAARWGSGCTFIDYDADGRLDLVRRQLPHLQSRHGASPGRRAALRLEGRARQLRSARDCPPTRTSCIATPARPSTMSPTPRASVASAVGIR